MACCRDCSRWFDSMQKVDDDGVVMDARDGWCLMLDREVVADDTPCTWFEDRDADSDDGFYSDEDMMRLGKSFMQPAMRERLPLQLPVTCVVAAMSYVAAVIGVRRAMLTADPVDVIISVFMACVGTLWLLIALRSGRDGR